VSYPWRNGRKKRRRTHANKSGGLKWRPYKKKSSKPVHGFESRTRCHLRQRAAYGWRVLTESAAFLEAKISLPVIHWLTDDYLVQQLDLENPGSLANPAGEAQIGFTRARGSCYAACGITGAMPYPVLCRTERGVLRDHAFSDTA